jgi:hypothetical protein
LENWLNGKVGFVVIKLVINQKSVPLNTPHRQADKHFRKLKKEL